MDASVRWLDESDVANVFVLLRGDPAALASTGFRLHSLTGRIVTGSVRVARIPDLAALEEVVRIEVPASPSLR